MAGSRHSLCNLSICAFKASNPRLTWHAVVLLANSARNLPASNTGSMRGVDDGNWRCNLNALYANTASPGEHLHTFRAGAIEGRRIGRVDVACNGEAICRRDLNDKQQHRSGAGLGHRAEFIEMF